MADSLSDFIRQLPIVDVHEHHMPETFLTDNLGLLGLLRQSYAGWTQQRPYPLPNEAPLSEFMEVGDGETAWQDIAAFVEGSGSNQFVRNLVYGLDDLYDLGGEGITPDNWRPLDQDIRERHADTGWPHEVMRRAGVQQVITDPFSAPMQNAAETLGSHYHSVLRVNALALGWQPDQPDHNGNCTTDFAKAINHPCDSFDDFCGLLEVLVETLGDRNQIGLKNALAYDRDIQFDAPDKTIARQAWKNPDASAEQKKAFGDFVVDRLCALAGERDIPVQMHLGSAIIQYSHPMKAQGLIERHPNTRFLLMHLAYPWSTDLLGMAFVHRNIWIDLTWSFLLSGSHFKRAFHEAIEILPDESRMMFGGDNWHAEESYATFCTARNLISDVLKEKCSSGYFKESDARRLAEKIFHRNAIAFFRIGLTEPTCIDLRRRKILLAITHRCQLLDQKSC